MAFSLVIRATGLAASPLNQRSTRPRVMSWAWNTAVGSPWSRIAVEIALSLSDLGFPGRVYGIAVLGYLVLNAYLSSDDER